MSFDRALKLVLEVEGGYSDHEKDPGGKTNLGITQATLDTARAAHPDLQLPSKVSDLMRSGAAGIYRRMYWQSAKCDEMPAPLALIVFDMAVNHGVGKAIRLLQQALGVRDDGSFGPVTRAAVADALLDGLLIELAARRQVFYASLSTFSTFGLGWSRRMQRVQLEAVRWLTHL